MPKLQNIKKVLVIGSGPIIIGQAAEFDYAGTQACRSLKEEGLEVVLVNSNPATIMTDVHIADRVYIEPVNVEFLESVIKRERPDSLLATLGGQVGLNLAIDLEEKGILREYNVQLLGTQIYSIKKIVSFSKKRWKKSISRFRKALSLKRWRQRRNLPVKSGFL